MKSEIKFEAFIFIGLVLFLRVIRNPYGRMAVLRREPFSDRSAALRHLRPEKKVKSLRKPSALNKVQEPSKKIDEVKSQEVSVEIPHPETPGYDLEQRSTPLDTLKNPLKNNQVEPEEIHIAISTPDSIENHDAESTPNYQNSPLQKDNTIVVATPANGQENSITDPSTINEKQTNEQGTEIVVLDNLSNPGQNSNEIYTAMQTPPQEGVPPKQNGETNPQIFGNNLPSSKTTDAHEVSVTTPQSENTNLEQNQEASNSKIDVNSQPISTGEVSQSNVDTPQNNQNEVTVTVPQPENTNLQLNQETFNSNIEVNSQPISNLETSTPNNQNPSKNQNVGSEIRIDFAAPEINTQPQQNEIQPQTNLEIQPLVITVRR